MANVPAIRRADMDFRRDGDFSTVLGSNHAIGQNSPIFLFTQLARVEKAGMALSKFLLHVLDRPAFLRRSEEFVRAFQPDFFFGHGHSLPRLCVY